MPNRNFLAFINKESKSELNPLALI